MISFLFKGHCASQGSILASTTASSASTTTMAKPPKEFADESTTSSSAEDIACHSQENNVSKDFKKYMDLYSNFKTSITPKNRKIIFEDQNSLYNSK